MSTLDVFERADGRWAWSLTADNGDIIATDGGQGYENRGYCEQIANAIVSGAYAPKRPRPASRARIFEVDVVDAAPQPRPRRRAKRR